MNTNLSKGSSNSTSMGLLPVTHTTVKVAITTAYGITFPVAIIGNILVIYIVLRKRGMRSVTNLLLVNMFVGNILVAGIAMPYSVSYLFLQHHWVGGIWGTLACKILHFAYALPIAASIFSLLLSSVDRYFAVLHPFRELRLIRNAKASTALIWLSSLFFMSPYLYKFQSLKMSDGKYYCMVNWSPFETKLASQIYFVIVFVFLYTIPLAIIGTLYFLIGLKLWRRKIPGHANRSSHRAAEKAKQKVLKMLIVVVSVFAVSWIPAHSMHVLVYFDSPRYVALPLWFQLLSFWICHANSAISPCLFIMFSEKFRHGFLALFESPSSDSYKSSRSSSSGKRISLMRSRKSQRLSTSGKRTGTSRSKGTEVISV